MTLKLRMILLCAASLFICGVLGSYKSFQIFSDHNQQAQLDKSYEVSTWVAQSVEQRLQQVEAAVSYLDKSTIETLKRFGARYFAYAYKKEGEWIIKWKVIGKAEKEQILSEVNEIDFEKVSNQHRSWFTAQNKQLIYVSPVELADSHQLKEGFLVFGFKKDFFAFLSRSDGPITLISRDAVPLHSHLPPSLVSDQNLFSSEENVIGHVEATIKGENRLLTSYFSHVAQAWIIRSQPVSAISFMESRFFTYFLFAGILAFLIFMVALGKMAQGDGVLSGLKTRSIGLPTFNFKMPELNFTLKKQIEREVPVASAEPQVIENFADFLDDILVDEMDRLDKVGVRVKTVVEEDAKVIGSPQHLSDLIKRLVGNSVLALENEDEKEIQIQLAEQKGFYQLIYVDTRTSHFPSGEEPSLLLQTEGSIEAIDGIISYASWLFGEGLTVAKKGFCLSVDLPIADGIASQTKPSTTEMPLQIEPLVPQLDRIEIRDEDTDGNLMSQFSMAELKDIKIEDEDPSAIDLNSDSFIIDNDTDEPKVSFDEVIDQFRMKEFEFRKDVAEPEEPILAADSSVEEIEEEIKMDEKGLFEFDSGQFKIKIRSPKKKDADVNS